MLQCATGHGKNTAKLVSIFQKIEGVQLGNDELFNLANNFLFK